jgi:hypothetical protein
MCCAHRRSSSVELCNVEIEGGKEGVKRPCCAGQKSRCAFHSCLERSEPGDWLQPSLPHDFILTSSVPKPNMLARLSGYTLYCPWGSCKDRSLLGCCQDSWLLHPLRPWGNLREGPQTPSFTENFPSSLPFSISSALTEAVLSLLCANWVYFGSRKPPTTRLLAHLLIHISNHTWCQSESSGPSP